MIIDIHTHTFPDKLASTTIPKLEQMSHTKSYVDGTNGGLMASMAKAGVKLFGGPSCGHQPQAGAAHQ